jgi:hypothetical protein
MAAEGESAQVQEERGIKFSGQGERTYQYLARRYGYSAFFVSLFLLGCFVRSRHPSGWEKSGVDIVLLIPLLLTLHQLWWIIAEKNLWSVETYWKEPHTYLARATVSFDWFCLLLVIGLTIIQLGFIISLCMNYKRREL